MIAYAQKLIENPLKQDSFLGLLTSILEVLVQVAIPFVALALIWFGFQLVFASSSGDSSKVEKAKAGIFWAVVGAFIIIASQAIVSVLENTYETIRSGSIHQEADKYT